jgi:hypothetical protein
MIHLSGIMFRVKEEVQAELDRGIDSGQRPGSRWAARVVEELKRLTHSGDDETTRFLRGIGTQIASKRTACTWIGLMAAGMTPARSQRMRLPSIAAT